MPKVAITFNKQVGGSSVLSLKESFKEVGCELVDADYRALMEEIPKEEFDVLYESLEGRQTLLAHAKLKAAAFLEEIDCLAISGAWTMADPTLYNKPRGEHPYDFSRTLAELALIHVAIQKGMPILGICAGHHEIAIYHGSSLRDLTAEELEEQTYFNYETITLKKDSLLAQIVRDKEAFEDPADLFEEMDFFGGHEQVVTELSSGFTQTAISCDGHSIEAAEANFGAPIICTQFHPEVGAKGFPTSPFSYTRTKKEIERSLEVFQYFKKAAEAYQQKKLLLQAIKTLKPEPDQENMSSSEIRSQQTFIKEEALEIEDPFINEPEVKQSLWKEFWEQVKNFFTKLIDKIKATINTFLRNRAAQIITSQKVSALQKKEEVLKSGPEQDSSSKILQVIMPAPAELLTNTPAQLWVPNQLFQPANSNIEAEETEAEEYLTQTLG